MLRSRGRKSLATSDFAGAYLARQGIYTLSPETALLLRNKSTAKGVIYYGSFQSGTEQGLHRNEQPPPTQQGAFLKGKGAFVADVVLAGRLGLMDKTIKRGDIYYADLNPVVGSEQGGTRPVLVISNDIGNRHSPTVIIAAITSRVRKKKKLPTHLYLGQIEGLPANSIILFEQLRTIDKSRLKEHLTHLDEQYLKSLEFPLLISIGVEKRRSL